ncbi:MAG: putative lipid II flippase FtsW [Acidimicrobiales bacterium]
MSSVSLQLGRAQGSRPAAVRRRAARPSVLVALVCLLCVAGVVMVGSASEVISIENYGSPWAILIREAMWMGLAALAFVFAARIDYHRLAELRVPLLLGTFALLALVLVPGIGVTAGGSSRWIGFSQFRVQPSELMKLAVVAFGAELIVRRQEKGGSDRTIIGPLLLVTAASCGLVLLQPDMGTALVIGVIAVSLLFASGVSMRPLLKVLCALGALAVIVGVADPYRRTRMLSFLDPGAHAAGSGYQVTQSLIGLGTGHLIGLGLGNGRGKWGSLPNAQTDFIFSVIGEELGLLGTIAVLVLLAALCWVAIGVAERAPDRFGSLVAIGLVAWLAAETFINIGAVLGLLPVTGIPLPFVSFGGSSLVITMVGTGILVNIARQGNHRPGQLPGTRARPAERVVARTRG